MRVSQNQHYAMYTPAENKSCNSISYIELMNLTITVVDEISSRAGQPLSIECSFQALSNLIRPPIVQWMNSTGSVQSDTSTLSFSPLLTSHGGEYTCTVIINIPELNIMLSGRGNTRITVQSETFTTQVFFVVHLHFCSSHYICCH